MAASTIYKLLKNNQLA
jgi:hypothetical protein